MIESGVSQEEESVVERGLAENSCFPFEACGIIWLFKLLSMFNFD